MNYEEYFKSVLSVAMSLGYTEYSVRCFSFDIRESYEDGLTVQECVDLHF